MFEDSPNLLRLQLCELSRCKHLCSEHKCHWDNCDECVVVKNDSSEYCEKHYISHEFKKYEYACDADSQIQPIDKIL